MRFNFLRLKKKPELYRKCRELPIHNFNEVANNNDLSFLKKNRNDVVPEHELQSAWVDILDEYFEISNNAIANNLFRKKSKLILLQSKLHVLESLKLCRENNIDIEQELKEYRIKEDKIQVQINLVKNDISRLSASVPGGEQKETSNTDFDKSIVVLNKHGFSINRFTTVVSEWVAALNFLEYQQQQNK